MTMMNDGVHDIGNDDLHNDYCFHDSDHDYCCGDDCEPDD